MAAEGINDSKADEAVKFIRDLDGISLDQYRVVGSCVRHDLAARDLLIEIKEAIIFCLQSDSAVHENYLIGGLPGSGKTFFVEELGRFISGGNFAAFVPLKLSDLNKITFQAELARLKDIRKPLLCLVDEIDKTLPDPWPFIALITPLEKQYRSYPTCFVLVGSGGSQVSKLKERIREVGPGDDLLRRISFKREADVPPTSLTDRIVVALSNLKQEARKSRSVVCRVDKLALLYFALNHELALPSRIASLAERCVEKKGKFRDTVHYVDLFDATDQELFQFQNKWNHTGLLKKYVYVEDQIRILEHGPRDKKFDEVFERVEIVFEREMQDNFLRNLDYSLQPDYIKLLSPDLRRLFGRFFKENNTILVAGIEGVGKTFNCLLFGKMLATEGFHAYYSSMRKADLLADIFLEAADLAFENCVFIIDDCQEDLNKTREIIKGIKASRFRKIGGPRFIFLSHPLDKIDTVEVFGGDIRILEFKERYSDLRYLAALFFKKMNMYSKFGEFLDWLDESNTSKVFAHYKNMRFWNIYFMAVELLGRIRIDEAEFLNSARQFFKRKKPQLIELKDPLAKLLPFFANGRFVPREYVDKELHIDEGLIRKLEVNKIVDSVSVLWEDKNWDNCVVPAIRCRIHPTEAKILKAILQKCDGMTIDDTKALIDYSNKYLQSLYYIMRDIQFYNFALLEDLCGNEQFKSTVQDYLKERHLGKHLDRTVRTLSHLPQQLRNGYINDEIVKGWIEKLNDVEYRMESKINLLDAIYKLSPVAAYRCYEELDLDTLTTNFRDVALRRKDAVQRFKEFIEVSKNICSFYLFSVDRVFENGLNADRVSDGLRRDFSIEGYSLSDDAKVEQISISRWKILDKKGDFLVRRTRGGNVLNVYRYTASESSRQAFLINKTKEALSKCLDALLDQFDTRHQFFSQMHWLLMRLDAMKLESWTRRSLANHLLEIIPPQKIVYWIKTKDTAAHELRFVLKTGRFVFVELEGKKWNLYHDFLKDAFNYEDIRRIFENRRSSLYSMCIVSRFAHERLANYLYQYSLEEGFAEKVLVEDLHCINESIEFVEKNPGLSDQQRRHIAYRIMSNTVSIKDLPWFASKSMRTAKKIGKPFDIDMEKERFLANKEKYVAPP